MSIMGTRVQRVEDPRFLTVGGTYVDDVRDERLAGAAWVTYVRSPVAHATLTRVDTEAAKAHPDAIAVITAGDLDLPPRRPDYGAPEAFGRPWLAVDRLRFVGEPIAAVVTASRLAGEDVAELVQLDFDPLPAVIDLDAAVADDTLLFPEAGTNVCATNALGELDVSPRFDECEVVVKQRIRNTRVAPAPIEPRGTACVWGADDRLTVWTSTQNPHMARDAFAKAAGVDRESVHLITPDVGGGFGAKIGISGEDIFIALLSRHLGRALRWTESRTESMQAMGHGRAQLQTVTIGGTRDGKIEAYQLDVIQDAGGYPNMGGMLPTLTMLMASGVYAITRVAFRSRSVVTNTCPTVAYRGAGRPEAAAAIERAVDRYAAEIGMDPAQVRMRNVIPPDAFPYTTPSGTVYDSGDYAAALQKVLEAANYAELREEQSKRRTRGDVVELGIGLSAYVEITGDGPSGNELARIEVHPNGRVTVWTGVSPHGQGHATSFAMIVADQLGVPLEAVTVRHGDTDELSRGGGTMGSRSLQLGGSAVHLVATRASDQATRLAADLLEAAEGDVRLDRDRGVFHVVGSPDDTRTWADVAEAAGDPRGLVVEEKYEAQNATFPFGAHLAVVEVDTETGQVRLVRLVSVDDAGRVINPVTAEGQRHGGLAQGAAQALQEQIVYDANGNPLSSNFADYAMVTAPDVPSFELLDMQTPTPLNPLGAKGIGESGAIGSTPAVQNAVVDALSHLGVRHVDMPCTPEAVWRTIQEAGGR
jgi:carbon-monoxide dehydrogenase large subunit